MARTRKMIKDTLKRTLSKNKNSKTNKSCDSTSTSACNCGGTAVMTKETKETKGLYIDYPSDSENVFCGYYCFRIGTVGNSEWTKVSINGGQWQNCRRANGYWWYDWWNFQTGSFTLEALSLIDGKEVKSSKRKFKVSL